MFKHPSAINNVMCLPSHFKSFSNFQPFFFQCGKPREEHVSSVILIILNYFQVLRASTKPLPYPQRKRKNSRGREESMAFIKAHTAVLSSKHNTACS
jgi:hypothetical protein